VTSEGDCPDCGRPVAASAREAVDQERQRVATESNLSLADVKRLAGEDSKAPWHFKLLVIALVLYLGWRLIEMIGWLF
jgi:hypothetical protein